MHVVDVHSNMEVTFARMLMNDQCCVVRRRSCAASGQVIVVDQSLHRRDDAQCLHNLCFNVSVVFLSSCINIKRLVIVKLLLIDHKIKSNC